MIRENVDLAGYISIHINGVINHRLVTEKDVKANYLHKSSRQMPAVGGMNEPINFWYRSKIRKVTRFLMEKNVASLYLQYYDQS